MKALADSIALQTPEGKFRSKQTHSNIYPHNSAIFIKFLVCSDTAVQACLATQTFEELKVDC